MAAATSKRLLLVAAIGCDDGLRSDPGPASRRDVVYDPPQHIATWLYQLRRDDGATEAAAARVVGVSPIGGQLYDRLQVGRLPDRDADPSAEYAELWVQPDDTVLQLAGFAVFNRAFGLKPGLADLSVTLAPPLRIASNVAVGVPQALTATAMLQVGDPQKRAPTQQAVTLFVHLLAVGETVATGVGIQGETAHFRAEMALAGATAVLDLWLRSGTGVVRADASWPGLPGPNKGATLGLTGLGGVAHSGDRTIANAESLLGPGHVTFRLDTWDVDGGAFADPLSPARCLLELRWADPSLARSDLPPPVASEFGVGSAYLAANLVELPLSTFHPEDNGQGLHFWVALVDIPASTQANPPLSALRVRSQHSGKASDVRVSALIEYRARKPGK